VSWTAADNREPLATTFAVRFATATNQTATVTVWRDAKINQNYFACGSFPTWYPLSQESLVFFDEQERPEVQSSVPFAPPPPGSNATPFALGTQRVRVGSSTLATSYAAGWVYMNLNTTITGSPNPSEDATAAQAWVTLQVKGPGRYSVGWPGIMLDSAKAASHIIIGF
jgi:hypothetical protein